MQDSAHSFASKRRPRECIVDLDARSRCARSRPPRLARRHVGPSVSSVVNLALRLASVFSPCLGLLPALRPRACLTQRSGRRPAAHACLPDPTVSIHYTPCCALPARCIPPLCWRVAVPQLCPPSSVGQYPSFPEFKRKRRLMKLLPWLPRSSAWPRLAPSHLNASPRERSLANDALPFPEPSGSPEPRGTAPSFHFTQTTEIIYRAAAVRAVPRALVEGFSQRH